MHIDINNKGSLEPFKQGTILEYIKDPTHLCIYLAPSETDMFWGVRIHNNQIYDYQGMYATEYWKPFTGKITIEC